MTLSPTTGPRIKKYNLLVIIIGNILISFYQRNMCDYNTSDRFKIHIQQKL